MGYLGLAIWLRRNTHPGERLGLTLSQLPVGLRWGTPAGIVLGLANAAVILGVVPLLGSDIQFLRQTPHARLPVAVMLPWAIVAIAVAIELNFRGFLLGRLCALSEKSGVGAAGRIVSRGVAIGLVSLVFSFDPFMVATFKHLHWIAIWDGLVWGTLWVRLKNLYATIVAHAVEVMIVYTILKIVLS